MRRRPRLLIFGIDGAPFALLSRWMRIGALPNMAKFAHASETSSLRCTWPPHTASGWTSLFAGRLPGAHGHFQFWNCQAPDYELHVTQREEAGVDTMWDVLARAGWTLGLVNLPMSHPAGPWPGYQVTWPLQVTLQFTKPKELVKEFRKVGGLCLPDIACMYDGKPDYPARARSFVRARLASLAYLMETRPTDALAVVFTESDRVMHHYWHAMDRGHPRHGDAEPSEACVVLDVMREIDDAFGAMLEMVGDDCNVLLVSDHGFGPGVSGVRIHHLLSDGGFCAMPLRASTAPADFENDTSHIGRLPLEWDRTSVYCPTPGSFGLNLNRKGRQRHGTVDDDDAAHVTADVCAYLQSLHVDRAPLFKAVLPAEAVYPGPFCASAPDLLLVPEKADMLVLRDIDGPTFDHPGQTGLHRLEGLSMYRGPNCRQGAVSVAGIESLAARMLADLKIEGMAPGDAALAGFARASRPLHDYMLDASTWSEATDGPCDWADDVAGMAARAPGQTAEGGGFFDMASEDMIKQRLQKMGYL